ncbi:leucine-rich repeat protein [Mycoplasmatota bacterium]|nr:leucine-rich repeat protein [Mycoplasmatota bacterium]
MKKLLVIIFVCFLSTIIVGCDNSTTITFNSNGGTEVSSITQDYNTKVTKPDDPTKTGYFFDGWYSDSDITTIYEFTKIPKKDITLYAKWNIKRYTITFNSNGGTEVSSITQDYNTKVTKPNDPTKTGYAFGGWYSDSDITTVYDFTSIPKEDITLYAKWIELSTEGLKYTLLEDNTYSVEGYSGSYPYLLIPKVYNGRAVTAIDSYAFSGVTSLKSVTIPNSITTIGGFAFYLDSNLTTVIFEEGSQLTTIEFSSFAEAKNLTSITIPNSVTTIEQGAFSGVRSLKNITIPSSVTTIGSRAFDNTTSLTNITIPSSVTSIGNNVFSEATSLKSINVDVDNPVYSSKDGVLLNKNQTKIICYPAGKNETTYTIPDSVTYISNQEFKGATSLESIKVEVDNPVYSSKDGVLLNKNQTKIICYPAGKNEATYTIPDSVTRIGNYAFYKATNLESITIPDSVIRIDDFAFYKASNLTSFTIPNSVTSIGNYAFKGATSITSITIPNSVAIIGMGTFEGATSLKTVIFEEGSQLTSIGYYVFKGATSLTNITIPDGVTTIGEGAFEGATSLTSITIPNSVKEIKSKTFKGVTSLRTIIFEEESQLSYIGWSAFEGATSLTSIAIPNSVKEIKSRTFKGATSLASIIIPDSVETIESYAFEGARSLTSITIPDSVISIESYAFKGATTLVSINVDVNNPEYSSKDGVLFSKNQTTIIAYPAGKNEITYTIPDSVTIISNYAFVGATSLTSINVGVNNPEYSSKDGVLFNKNQTTIIAYPAGKNEIIYTIPDSVETIESYAFYKVTSLTSITISYSVTTIGWSAFEGAESLTSINVDVDNLEYSSKDGVLFNKNQTAIITYPKGKNEITFTIPNSVTTIGSHAFEGETSLMNLTISDSVTTIGNHAFEGATSLTSIIINATTPPLIENIGVSNSNLKIYVPSDYISIYKDAWPKYASIIYTIENNN